MLGPWYITHYRSPYALQVKDRIKQLFPLIDKNGDHFLDDGELRAWTLGNGAERVLQCFGARLTLPAPSRSSYTRSCQVAGKDLE